MTRTHMHACRRTSESFWFMRGVALFGLMVMPLLMPSRLPAHEIPVSIVVQALVKVEADRLRLLVRVPMEAVAGQEITLPTFGIGYLDLENLDRLGEATRTAITDYVRFFENGRDLGEGTVVAFRVSLPSDRSFETFDAALSHVTGPPLPDGTELYWQQATFDVLVEYDIVSPESSFSIHPEWARLSQRTSTVLRLIQPGADERLIQYFGDPGTVQLNPRWYQAGLQFVKLGFWHILEGLDHLLFVILLVIPFRRFLPLVGIVTSFTVAHSVTLGASALGFAPAGMWFPPMIEVLIALSIVYMAIENMVGGATLRRRWTVAFGFGLVHGFGFAFHLSESLQFAGSHLPTALLAFNIGVEVGQVLILLIAVPLLELLFTRGIRERTGVLVLSGLIAHTSWHWMTEHWSHLLEHQFSWPVPDLLLLAQVLRWTAFAIALVGLFWMISRVLMHFAAHDPLVKDELVTPAETPKESWWKGGWVP